GRAQLMRHAIDERYTLRRERICAPLLDENRAGDRHDEKCEGACADDCWQVMHLTRLAPIERGKLPCAKASAHWQKEVGFAKLTERARVRQDAVTCAKKTGRAATGRGARKGFRRAA